MSFLLALYLLFHVILGTYLSTDFLCDTQKDFGKIEIYDIFGGVIMFIFGPPAVLIMIPLALLC